MGAPHIQAAAVTYGCRVQLNLSDFEGDKPVQGSSQQQDAAVPNVQDKVSQYPEVGDLNTELMIEDSDVLPLASYVPRVVILYSGDC